MKIYKILMIFILVLGLSTLTESSTFVQLNQTNPSTIEGAIPIITLYNVSAAIVDTNATTECGDTELLQGDGSCVDITAIGSATYPAGIQGAIQFNDSGSFGGSSNFRWDDGSNQLYVSSGGSSGIGIGTLNPARRIESVEGTDPQLRLTDTIGSKYVDLRAGGDGDLYIFTSDSAFIYLKWKHKTTKVAVIPANHIYPACLSYCDIPVEMVERDKNHMKSNA